MSPIRVDFYILGSGEVSLSQTDPQEQTTEEQASLLFSCRLLEKAWLRGHKVFVYCKHKQAAETLDELLWTFRDDSFIPHNIQGEGPQPPPPVQIGYENEPRGFNDILLNLAEEIPPFYRRFRRIMEVVMNDETAREISRARFRQYRSMECELFTHHVE